MNNKIKLEIINKIKENNLEEYFNLKSTFEEWLLKLNDRQISNFLSLNLDNIVLTFPKKYLLNLDLLNTDDYFNKIDAFNKINNMEGWYHLFGNMMNPNFLNSSKFYDDMEKLYRAKTAQYVLWIIGNDGFINSPYHDEDLTLLVDSVDTSNRGCDFVVWDALATVASNLNSIRSPHHREDMKLIATCGSEYLQMSGSFPEASINNLACNKVSLSDPYHYQAMRLLMKYPEYGEFLYNLMTNEVIVNGAYYLEELISFSYAKDEVAARCLYYYIMNPADKYNNDRSIDFSDYYKINGDNSSKINHYDLLQIVDNPAVKQVPFIFYDKQAWERKNIELKQYDNLKHFKEYDYRNGLSTIASLEGDYAYFYTSLLMNPVFFMSPYKHTDLEILKSLELNNKDDKQRFLNIYYLLVNKVFQNSKYHKQDLYLILNSDLDKFHELFKLATSEDNILSKNHLYDMEFVNSVNLSDLPLGLLKQIRMYLYYSGLDAADHKEVLEKIKDIIKEGNYSLNNESFFDELLNELTIVNKEFVPKKVNTKEETNNHKVIKLIKGLFK